MTERHTDGLPAERDLPAVRRSVRRDHLMTEFTAHTPRRRLSKGLRRAVAGVGAAIVLTGGGLGVATASGLFTVGGAGESIYVDCMANTQVDGPMTTMRTGPGGAVETCRGLWRQGAVGEGTHTAPRHLIGCIAKDWKGRPGRVTVYPGTEATCRHLGLPTAQPPTKQELAYSAQVGAVDTDLSKAFTAGCYSEKKMAAIARRSLDRHGLADWRVTHERKGPGTRCWDGSVDQVGRSVVISRIPRN